MTIAILAKNLFEYRHGVEKFFLDGMERYHKVEFEKQGNRYVTDKYIIKPAFFLKDVQGLQGYQLVKYGNWMDNPEAGKIIEHYEIDVEMRQLSDRNK